VLLTLVIDEDRGVAEASLSAAADAIMARAKSVTTVAVSTRARRSPQLLGRHLAVIRGAASAPDAVAVPGGGTIEIPAVPGAFAQAHRGQAARIREHIREHIRAHGRSLDGLHVVDAYAGSGALGLALAKAGARVTLIESFAPAMELARRAADEARLTSIETRAGNAATVLGALADAGRAGAVDVVVLNPPRRGVAPEARDATARLRPSLLFYVSCEPETLARDLAHFALLGYAAAGEGALTAYDMIPLTNEVETLACLTKAAPPPPAILFAKDDLVAVDKAPHEPTTPHPEHLGSLLARVSALPGFARATPVHRLDVGTSGVCLFARTEGDVARHQEALSADDAEKEYRVLARGITREKGVVKRPLPDERGVPRDALTRYRRIAIVSGHSLLAVRIETGRTHQIRKHLASLGHPVVGDRRYGHAPTNRHFEERYGLDRPFLHAARVELDDPVTESRLSIEAPLAPDLEAVLDRLHRASG
jgi:23S rRNA (uracil1939-C5)-methyltransferase